MNILIIVGILMIIIVGVLALIFIGSGSGERKKNELYQLKQSIKSLESKATSANPSDRNDSLIQADSYFGKALRVYLGNTSSTGENLKEIRYKYDKKTYNQIWEAHKKRNRVVHENEQLSAIEAKRYLKTFQKGVNNLI